MRGKTWMQRAAVLAVALCAGLVWSQSSYAGVGTRVDAGTLQSSSGVWGVVTSSTTFAFVQPTQRIFFTATNVGTLPLRGATYTISVTGLKAGTFWVLACVGGTWNTATGSCAGGTQQTVASTTGAMTTATTTAVGTYPATVQSSISLQAYIDKPARATATIGVSVSRSEVRAAVVTDA